MLYTIILAIIMNAQTDAKLIYVGDPMCSWCYGLAPELEKLVDHYDGKLKVEVVMGGLRPYNTETMSDLKDFLTGHWQEVNHRSGQEFSYGILESKEIAYDTEPPSRAVVVVRTLSPKNELVFFKRVQKAFYLENKNMHLSESYHAILKDLSIDKDRFDQLFHSDEMKKMVKQDFERAAELQVSSFPTILLQKEGKLHPIARGFSTAEKMIGRVENLIN